MHRFKVSGMSCGGCAQSVTRAVKGVDPRATVEVDLASGTVTVRSGSDVAAVAAAIEGAGYGVERTAA